MVSPYKADWAEAERRLTALWQGERLERPCVSVIAPQRCEKPTPLPTVEKCEDIWLDHAYRVAATRHQLENRWWGGEALPSALQMAGWVMCLGGTPHFDDRTIWFEVEEAYFSRPSSFRHDPESIWTKGYEELMMAVARDAGEGEYMVGSACALPANDLLSMLMGTENFLMATIDHPEWLAEAIVAGARDQARAVIKVREVVRETGHKYWYGNAGWMPFWAPVPYKGTQSDVSCMLSTEAFDKFVLPELEIYAEAFGWLWYHLDGCDARHHLPRLLSLPMLRVVQYTPTPGEPPNGPAHLEMYRAIQAAGKIVHISLSQIHFEQLIRELDPTLLMLDTWVGSVSEGEKLLEQCAAWMR